MPINRTTGPVRPYHGNKELERAKEEARLELEEVTDALKPLVISLVEKAFRKYCKAHHAPKYLEDVEWGRFEKILKRVL